MLFILKCVLIVFGFAFLIRFLTRKYICSWKLYMVIGPKRSGKSTLAVKLACKYLKKGYVVYTNMEDVTIPGVRIINPADLEKYRPVGKSVLLIDEAGSLYDNREFKSFKRGTRDFFIYQGHYKCVVWLFSQAHNVDKKLRDLTDNFYLLHKFVNVFVWCQCFKRKVVALKSENNISGDLFGEELHSMFFRSKFVWIPRWCKKFDSFVLPDDREYLPYTEVPNNNSVVKK